MTLWAVLPSDELITCKVLKINKGGVGGGYPRAGIREQGTGKARGFGCWSWIDCAPAGRNYLQTTCHLRWGQRPSAGSGRGGAALLGFSLGAMGCYRKLRISSQWKRITRIISLDARCGYEMSCSQLPIAPESALVLWALPCGGLRHILFLRIASEQG